MITEEMVLSVAAILISLITFSLVLSENVRLQKEVDALKKLMGAIQKVKRELKKRS